MLHDNFIKTAKQESHEFKALLNILSSLNLHTKEGRKLLCVLNNIIDYYINREVEYSDDVKMPYISHYVKIGLRCYVRNLLH